MRSIPAIVAAPALAAGLAAPLFSQCSMCRAAAAAQGPAAAQAMNTAILLLLMPAVALFSGIIALAFWSARRRNT